MSDFAFLPLQKLLNRENIVSRVEQIEGRTHAQPSAIAGKLGEISGNTGDLSIDGSIQVIDRATGNAVVKIDDNGIFMQNSADGWFNFEDAAGNSGTINIAADPNNDFEFVNLATSPDGMISFFLKNTSGATALVQRMYRHPSISDKFITALYGDLVVSGEGKIYINDDNSLDDGWFPTTDTITRTGDHTFTVPTNRTTQFRKGAKFAYTDALANEYGVVTSSAYVTTDDATTVTLITNTDYTMSTDAIASPSLSYIENPAGFPQWFNWDAAPTGFSVVPATPVYRWKTSGNMITIAYLEGTNGTSNATTFTATIPVASVYAVTGAAGTLVDNGALLTTAGRVTISAGGTSMTFRTDMSVGAWTNANGKRAVAILTYEY